MGAEENVATMKRAYEAFNVADLDTLLGQRTDGTFRAELERFMADDDGRVVGFQRSTGNRNGSHLDVGNCIVFTLEDGKVIDGREHFEDLYAWDQFWS
jgi:ketosteroid isomerase-like protein